MSGPFSLCYYAALDIWRLRACPGRVPLLVAKSAIGDKGTNRHRPSLHVYHRPESNETERVLRSNASRKTSHQLGVPGIDQRLRI